MLVYYLVLIVNNYYSLLILIAKNSLVFFQFFINDSKTYLMTKSLIINYLYYYKQISLKIHSIYLIY